MRSLKWAFWVTATHTVDSWHLHEYLVSVSSFLSYQWSWESRNTFSQHMFFKQEKSLTFDLVQWGVTLNTAILKTLFKIAITLSAETAELVRHMAKLDYLISVLRTSVTEGKTTPEKCPLISHRYIIKFLSGYAHTMVWKINELLTYLIYSSTCLTLWV